MTWFGPAGASHDARGVRRGAFLAMLQAPLPVISSSGASLATLANWFAAQPGMPPSLVAQIRALGDPAQSLPIPVPFNAQAARTVNVDGASGFAFGDETGIGSVFLWTKSGTFYAVGGTLPESELRTVVDSITG